MIGLIVMIFILLFLTVGLVVSVRFLLRRVRDSVVAKRASVPAGGGRRIDEPLDREESEGDRPMNGRELKERYLRGEMSKADYDRRLRALQLDDYLRGLK